MEIGARNIKFLLNYAFAIANAKKISYICTVKFVYSAHIEFQRRSAPGGFRRLKRQKPRVCTVIMLNYNELQTKISVYSFDKYATPPPVSRCHDPLLNTSKSVTGCISHCVSRDFPTSSGCSSSHNIHPLTRTFE